MLTGANLDMAVVAIDVDALSPFPGFVDLAILYLLAKIARKQKLTDSKQSKNKNVSVSGFEEMTVQDHRGS